MDWSIAGYSSHPIDGEASRIEDCATHLGTVAGQIREQITRLGGLNSCEFWQSGAGSADAFQEVIEDLPEKLDLVATRYERVNEALTTFHPTIATAKEDAEFWIGQAEEAQGEVERTQAGVEEMESFEDSAEEGESWEGEDYGQGLEQAEGDVETAVNNVHNAVEAFESAAQTCAESIREACDDDLKNDRGWFGIDISWDDILDVLEVVVTVLQVVALALAVVALFVTGLGFVIFVVAAAIFVGTLILFLNDRADGWDLALASIGFVAAGLGAFSQGFANIMKGGTFLKSGSDAITAGSNVAVQVARVEAIAGLTGFGALLIDGTLGLTKDRNEGFSFSVDSAVGNLETAAPYLAPLPALVLPELVGMSDGDVTAASQPVDVDVPDVTALPVQPLSEDVPA